MGYEAGNKVSSVYWQFLAAALAAYVAVSSFWLANLITRVGDIEHEIEHKHHPGHK